MLSIIAALAILKRKFVCPYCKKTFSLLFWLFVHGKEIPNSSSSSDGAAVCIVMASGGYPERYKKGFPIKGLKEAELLENIHVFHAGTRDDNGTIVTNWRSRF